MKLHTRGMALMEATLKEAPHAFTGDIVMTSLAFVFGVLPMTSSQGVSSASQHAVNSDGRIDDHR